MAKQSATPGRSRHNPWWAVLLTWSLGGVLALVAGRMLPWQSDEGEGGEPF